jgi:predicted  nucleic acid-binding Zn-ribbon protein
LRQKEQIEAENKFLSGEVSKARRRKDQLEDDVTALRSERASLAANFEAEKVHYLAVVQYVDRVFDSFNTNDNEIGQDRETINGCNCSTK